MRLLDRRRPGRRAHAGRETEPAIGTPPEREIIRPEDLVDRPGWSTLPPPEPLLPPVPFVVSRTFSDDLVSWQAPELFVAPLAHGVSELAPIGTVEARTVPTGTATVSTIPDTQATGYPELVLPARPGDSGLTEVTDFGTDGERPLLTGSAGTSESRGTSEWRAASESRRAPIPEPQQVPQPPPSGLPAAEPSMSLPVREDRKAAAPPEPAAITPGWPAPAEGQPVSRPLVTAPAPPNMPLARVAGARLIPSDERRDRSEPHSGAIEQPGSAAPTAPDPEIGPQTGQGTNPLLGDGQAPSIQPTRSTTLVTPDQDAAEGTAIGPNADSMPVVAQQPEAGSAEPAESPAFSDQPRVPGVSVPLADGPAPGDEAKPPLIGTRRSGLGAPMHQLPPTAASLDVAALTERQSRRARQMLAGRAAAGPSPANPFLQLATRHAPPATAPATPRPPLHVQTVMTVSEAADMPVVALEGLGPVFAGKAPADLPQLDAAPGIPTTRLGQPGLPGRSGAAEGRAVRTLVGQRFGVDLSSIPVDRTPQSAAAARRMDARAYATAGAVVIPPEVGTLDAGPGAALLAHELTHAAQRKLHGNRMPGEHTPAGSTLESQALEVESKLGSPATPFGRSLSAAAAVPPHQAGGGTGFGRAAFAQTPLPTVPAGFAATRSSLGQSSQAAALPLAHHTTPSSVAETQPLLTPPAGFESTITIVAPPSAGSPPVAPASPAPAAQAGGVQRAAEGPALGVQPAKTPNAPQRMFDKRPDDADLHRLASWLYPLISFKIRGELRTDRERAGLLTDSYRRW